MNSIYFRRKPYNTFYKDFHTGEVKKIKRRPPPKLHNMLPTDVVELKSKKNQDWEQGEEYKIKHLTYRAPNTIQLEDDDGLTTFVSSFDLDLVEKVAYRGETQADSPDANKYLIWP